jgi:hypothetical protein
MSSCRAMRALPGGAPCRSSSSVQISNTGNTASQPQVVRPTPPPGGAPGALRAAPPPARTRGTGRTPSPPRRTRLARTAVAPRLWRSVDSPPARGAACPRPGRRRRQALPARPGEAPAAGFRHRLRDRAPDWLSRAAAGRPTAHRPLLAVPADVALMTSGPHLAPRGSRDVGRIGVGVHPVCRTVRARAGAAVDPRVRRRLCLVSAALWTGATGRVGTAQSGAGACTCRAGHVMSDGTAGPRAAARPCAAGGGGPAPGRRVPGARRRDHPPGWPSCRWSPSRCLLALDVPRAAAFGPDPWCWYSRFLGPTCHKKLPCRRLTVRGVCRVGRRV